MHENNQDLSMNAHRKNQYIYGMDLVLVYRKISKAKYYIVGFENMQPLNSLGSNLVLTRNRDTIF